MLELTNAHQRKDELVVDFIYRWSSLSLNGQDRLSETSGIEMCIQGMHWGLPYVLQGIKPKTFEKLTTRAHDMELNMAINADQGLPVFEPYDEEQEQESEDGGMFSFENETEESMHVNMLLNARA